MILFSLDFIIYKITDVNLNSLALKMVHTWILAAA